ncbi:MAG: hypothetical protein HC827_05855 [Cyanobacteria bacterium RM1_2_2]|nr:hypothetical protein [Cyanobacteria bacterium RM1_2_2]
MNEALLSNRDYTVIIAKTASERSINPPRFTERWTVAESAVMTLIQKCQDFDPDGITLYVSCRSPEETCMFKKYEHVKAVELAQIVQAGYPPEQVDLQTVLEDAIESYFNRKAAQQTKPNGELIVVLLDGEPSDRMAVAKLIKNTTHQLSSDQELRINFVQIGDDGIAHGFLSALDENLQSAGAKFDIVSTKFLAEIQPNSLTEFLLETLHG